MSFTVVDPPFVLFSIIISLLGLVLGKANFSLSLSVVLRTWVTRSAPMSWIKFWHYTLVRILPYSWLHHLCNTQNGGLPIRHFLHHHFCHLYLSVGSFTCLSAFLQSSRTRWYRYGTSIPFMESRNVRLLCPTILPRFLGLFHPYAKLLTFVWLSSGAFVLV